jgi:hypothetical protein
MDRESNRIGSWLTFGVALAGALTIGRATLATDVTSCGQTIAAGDTGVLQADLDCSASEWGVRLRPMATLNLNGHAIKGGSATYAVVAGVGTGDQAELYEQGKGNFTVLGPGSISGVIVDPNLVVGTYGCVVLNDGYARISSASGSVDIHDCVFGVVGNLESYSTSKARAAIDHTLLHDAVLEGVTVRYLAVSYVSAYNNGGAGIHAISTLTANNAVSYDNFSQGLFATRKLQGTNITAYGNRVGVESFKNIRITGLTATGNTEAGAESLRRVTLENSTVTGNGSLAGVDIRSGRSPRLVSTACDTSANFSSQTWSTCAND